MTSENCPDDDLNYIWKVFFDAGITDDLQIIEALAYFLLVWKANRWNELEQVVRQSGDRRDRLSKDANEFVLVVDRYVFPNVPYPQPPDLRYESVDRLMPAIAAACQATSPATLLNHCLLFRPKQMLAGGRYATPRHLAGTMVRLATILNRDEDLIVADLACGSGGLLVETPFAFEVMGCEISPNWARIAATNVILHDAPEPDIYLGNTLATFLERNVPRRFNCLVMNPPFGATMDRYLVQHTLHWDAQARSETALTMLGFRELAPEGSMAVLLPAGVLFSTSHTEQSLRHALLTDGHLDAVIELPKDALQPYTSIQTYLLLARKTQTQAEEPVWFYQVRHDGFSGGRNRQPEPAQNELPRLEAAVQAQITPPAIRVAADDRLILSAHRLPEQQGFLVRQHIPGQLQLDHLTTTGGSSGLLASATNETATTQGQILFWQAETHISTGANQPFTLPPGLTQTSPQPEQPGYQLAGDKARGYSLIRNQAGRHPFRLVKSNQTPIHLEPWTGHTDAQPIWLVVDKDGLLSAQPCTPRSPAKDFMFNEVVALPLEDAQENPLGHLIILPGRTISAVPFNPTPEGSATQLYTIAWGQNTLLIWSAPDQPARFVLTTAATTFKGQKQDRAVAVDGQGNWFGIGVEPTYILANQQLDLQPASYFPARQEVIESRSPAQILADLKQKQQELDRHLSFLLGIVELRPISETAIPPAVKLALPLGPLSPKQVQIWQAIQQQVEPVDEGERLITAKPFRAETFHEVFGTTEVANTLALLERMGLIVPISIADAPYYRLLTERDLIHTPEAEHEG